MTLLYSAFPQREELVSLEIQEISFRIFQGLLLENIEFILVKQLILLR